MYLINPLLSLVCRIPLCEKSTVFLQIPDGHLGRFWYRAIRNKASVNIIEHVLLVNIYFSSINLGENLLGYMLCK